MSRLPLSTLPNQGLELTASSVRSCVAPASGSSSGLAFGVSPESVLGDKQRKEIFHDTYHSTSDEHKELLPHLEQLLAVADAVGEVSLESLQQAVDKVYAFLIHHG